VGTGASSGWRIPNRVVWVASVMRLSTASLGACVLVYTGLSMSIRRLTAKFKRREIVSSCEIYAKQPVG
jgi:hypothetical protein